jgi:hypothetical protein
METIVTQPEADTDETSATAKPGTVIIDLGKKKRSQVKKLRKGQGKLMEDVNELVADMQKDGTMQSKDQQVVVVVREKKRRLFGLI